MYQDIYRSQFSLGAGVVPKHRALDGAARVLGDVAHVDLFLLVIVAAESAVFVENPSAGFCPLQLFGYQYSFFIILLLNTHILLREL